MKPDIDFKMLLRAVIHRLMEVMELLHKIGGTMVAPDFLLPVDLWRPVKIDPQCFHVFAMCSESCLIHVPPFAHR